jgi:hypothetical protein
LTKLRHGAAVLLGAAVLVACGPLVIRDDARREYVPLTSAVLDLHRDVVVPPERARVFFQ